jgi:hypothetical protein
VPAQAKDLFADAEPAEGIPTFLSDVASIFGLTYRAPTKRCFGTLRYALGKANPF